MWYQRQPRSRVSHSGFGRDNRPRRVSELAEFGEHLMLDLRDGENGDPAWPVLASPRREFPAPSQLMG